MTVKTVTAAQVRAFFLANDKRMASLSEAGQANVRATRGALSREVATAHNKRRKTSQYPLDSLSKGRPLTEAGAARRQAKDEAQALRQAARDAGHKVGARGRIPAKALAAVSKG